MRNQILSLRLSLLAGLALVTTSVACMEPPPSLPDDELDSVAAAANSESPVCDGRSLYRTRYARPAQDVPLRATTGSEAAAACAQVLIAGSRPLPSNPAVRCPGCPAGGEGCQVTDATVRRGDIYFRNGVWYCAAGGLANAVNAATIYWRCGLCRPVGPVPCRDNSGCARGEYCEKGAANCGGAGVCTPRPGNGCTKNLAPVCGCDGNTYDNDCLAAAAGVSIAHPGTCSPECCDPALEPGQPGVPLCYEGASCCANGQWACNDAGAHPTCRQLGQVCPPAPCRSNADCKNSQYCEAASCGDPGTCAPRPRFCPLNYDPVCGCDGNTYGNSCAAAAAGVNVASRGACPVQCATDADCPAGKVCELGLGCARPMICVPGCHADSDCRAGQTCNTLIQCLTCPCPGRCDPPAPCRTNADCSNTSYCEANGCNVAGVCAPRPQGCPRNYDPVCGCDGKTYPNACGAAAAGVNVASTGVCPLKCATDADCPAGQVCEPGLGCGRPAICVPGCHADRDCAAGQVCTPLQCLTCPCPGRCEPPPPCTSNADCKPTAYCQAPGCNAAGVCATRPQACPLNYDPVCGCDGKTYGNACEAAAAGVNVASRGACPIPCATDADCPAGKVCEPGVGCGRPTSCVPGCHNDGQCPAGQACNQQVLCLTCPCPGRCEPRPLCKTNADCSNTSYCHAPGCNLPGVCEPRPQVCTAIGNPVCGCDGMTYGNPCSAAGAGVNVDHPGACGTPCCDPAQEPGKNGNPFCFEGASCCADGTWACNDAGANPTCVLGRVCPIRCAADADCPAGQVCEPGLGCGLPKLCVPGCRTDRECPAGQVCNHVQCLTCPCPGMCQPPPPCRTNADCSNTSYCQAPGCNVSGVCAPRPQFCTAIADPVCGCDGNTYGNPCAAAGAGVNIDHPGPCVAPCCDPAKEPGQNGNPFCFEGASCCSDGSWACNDAGAQPTCRQLGQVCPIRCAADADCPAGLVCEPGLGCGLPKLCVPGCHTDQQCPAREVCHRVQCLTCPCPGRCGPPPPCKTNADCSNTSFCRAPGCNVDGVCAPRPQFCLAIADPVCGCDGKTYGNECEAAGAGVNVASKGPCPIRCGADTDCPAGQVCEPGVGCNLPMLCVPGCHSDRDCAAGHTCNQPLCLTCPCPGRCSN